MEHALEIEELGERLVKGIPASAGIAIGKVWVQSEPFSHIREKPIQERQIPTEITRIKEAASIVKKRLKGDRSRLLRRVNRKDSGIFSVHIFILEDSHFLNRVTSGVGEERINAETVVIRELDKYSAFFRGSKTPI